MSHDLEDVFAVLNSRPETVSEIASAPDECRAAVLPRLVSLRGHLDYEIAAEGHLANDVPGQAKIVLARIDAILHA